MRTKEPHGLSAVVCKACLRLRVIYSLSEESKLSSFNIFLRDPRVHGCEEVAANVSHCALFIREWRDEGHFLSSRAI